MMGMTMDAMQESVIRVDGLLTALCARNVEKALLRMPGVHHAMANVTAQPIGAER